MWLKGGLPVPCSAVSSQLDEHPVSIETPFKVVTSHLLLCVATSLKALFFQKPQPQRTVGKRPSEDSLNAGPVDGSVSLTLTIALCDEANESFILRYYGQKSQYNLPLIK
jgi:hypothetical protein